MWLISDRVSKSLILFSSHSCRVDDETNVVMSSEIRAAADRARLPTRARKNAWSYWERGVVQLLWESGVRPRVMRVRRIVKKHPSWVTPKREFVALVLRLMAME